jgi:hypothetical protein
MSSPMNNYQFINLVRHYIGLKPLSAHGRNGAGHIKQGGKHLPPGAGSYIRLQKLQNRANPDCKLCGGAGYNMGGSEDYELKCKCLKAA